MSNGIHVLAQQLTGKATIEECSLEELRHIAEHHSFFAPAQFLFLQKLKQFDAAEAEAQYNKAVLFYYDPLLFDYFILSEKFYVDEEKLFDKQDQPVITDASDEVSTHSFSQENGLVSEAVTEEGEASEEININENTEENNSSNSIQKEVITEVGDDLQTAEKALSNISENEIAETNESIVVNENMEEDNSSISLQEEVMYEVDNRIQIQEETTVDILENEEIEEKAIEEKIDEQEISFPLLKNLSIATTDLSPLIFEPYQTVDYFASQGIKISQEELPKDKLSKQLKSFTQWLKTMKRLPSTPATDSPQTGAEKKVETMAGLSVSQSEVVTEAMAEVWAKQGNIEKAMETYNKLSLLNPSKTTYFVAKIENLKSE